MKSSIRYWEFIRNQRPCEHGMEAPLTSGKNLFQSLCYFSTLQMITLPGAWLPGNSAGSHPSHSKDYPPDRRSWVFPFLSLSFWVLLPSVVTGVLFSSECASLKLLTTEIRSADHERCPLCRLFHKLIQPACYGKMWTFIPVLSNEEYVGGAVYHSSLLYYTCACVCVCVRNTARVVSLFIERSSETERRCQ